MLLSIFCLNLCARTKVAVLHAVLHAFSQLPVKPLLSFLLIKGEQAT